MRRFLLSSLAVVVVVVLLASYPDGRECLYGVVDALTLGSLTAVRLVNQL